MFCVGNDISFDFLIFKKVINVSTNTVKMIIPSTDANQLFDAIKRANIEKYSTMMFHEIPLIHRSPLFLDYINFPFLTSISINQAEMTQDDFEQLCTILSQNPSNALKVLGVQYNFITDARPLSAIIDTHQQIERLLLTANPIAYIERDMQHIFNGSRRSRGICVNLHQCSALSFERAYHFKRFIWTVPGLKVHYSTSEPSNPKYIPQNPIDPIFIKGATTKGIPRDIIRQIIISLLN